ncbi:MAG: hypothetical protein JWO46_1945, partial [Nocardioidaceae bacterium]|nr:hypothetical protein [Nocardioidaceae bacterium]
FCGGTLADEAMLLVQQARGPVRAPIPLRPQRAHGPHQRADGDVVVDFGDDGLTQGRPHPMIDPSLRMERIAVEAADPGCGVLLLDLVLGYGAHPDPAGELAGAIAAARRTRELPVVVTVVGTAGDPQGLDACRAALFAAGASVFVSNARATRHALSLLEAPRG